MTKHLGKNHLQPPENELAGKNHLQPPENELAGKNHAIIQFGETVWVLRGDGRGGLKLEEFDFSGLTQADRLAFSAVPRTDLREFLDEKPVVSAISGTDFGKIALRSSESLTKVTYKLHCEISTTAGQLAITEEQLCSLFITPEERRPGSQDAADFLVIPCDGHSDLLALVLYSENEPPKIVVINPESGRNSDSDAIGSISIAAAFIEKMANGVETVMAARALDNVRALEEMRTAGLVSYTIGKEAIRVPAVKSLAAALLKMRVLFLSHLNIASAETKTVEKFRKRWLSFVQPKMTFKLDAFWNTFAALDPNTTSRQRGVISGSGSTQNRRLERQSERQPLPSRPSNPPSRGVERSYGSSHGGSGTSIRQEARRYLLERQLVEAKDAQVFLKRNLYTVPLSPYEVAGGPNDLQPFLNNAFNLFPSPEALYTETQDYDFYIQSRDLLWLTLQRVLRVLREYRPNQGNSFGSRQLLKSTDYSQLSLFGAVGQEIMRPLPYPLQPIKDSSPNAHVILRTAASSMANVGRSRLNNMSPPQKRSLRSEVKEQAAPQLRDVTMQELEQIARQLDFFFNGDVPDLPVLLMAEIIWGYQLLAATNTILTSLSSQQRPAESVRLLYQSLEEAVSVVCTPIARNVPPYCIIEQF